MKSIQLFRGIAAATILLTSTLALAQQELETTEEQHYKNSLGFGAGLSTGWGLSYRYFGNKLGVQANFSPYKDETEIIVSSGLTFLYRLIRLKKASFFVYQANHYFFREKEQYDYDYSSNAVINKGLKEEKYFNNGAGLGMEFLFYENRAGFNVMLGYAGIKDFTEINFTGETALYFRF